MVLENILWQRLIPCVSALVVRINLLYMYKSFTYIFTEVMKHNVNVFISRTYFTKSCKLNSSQVILKFLAMHDQFLQKNLKTGIFHFLH